MLARLAYNARIFGKLQLLHIRAHLEYEADFWIGIAGVVLTHAAGFAFIWTLLSRVPEVEGWTLWEVCFLYALAILPRGLMEVLYNGQWRLRHLVSSGELDRLLVRPVSPALQVVTQSASIHGFGTLALGLAILSGASAELGFAWTPARLLFLTETVLASTVLIGSVHYATNCVAFWNAGASSAFPFLVAHCSEFAKFPTSVYGRFLQIALTWVLPLAFVSYYPGATLLGRPEVSPWLGYATPLAALAIALVAGLIWRLGLRRYQGTGH